MTRTKFTRNRFTLSAYIMLGFYSYMKGTLGPIMPLVRDDLSLNYTMTGLHLTSFALGIIIAGASGASVVHRIGRKRLFWGGGLGMCLGSGLLMTAQIAPLTIFGTFLMGWLGAYLVVMIQSTLADEHRENRAIAFTESNIMASLFAVFAPIMVGIGTSLSLTWRFAPVLGVGVWLTVILLNRQMSFPKPQSNDDNDISSIHRLPRLFWLYAIVIFLGVALEWCVFFWSADFLNSVVLLSPEQAATMTSVFLLAIVIGRLIGSRLTHHHAPQNLLWVAVAVIGIGFPMFWIGRLKVVNIAGLFIVGLGIANLFPLGLSIASRIGRQASDLASSRVSLVSGLAIFSLPQILGSTADMVGIFNAFAIVPLFLLLLAMTLAFANHRTQSI